MRRLIAWLLLRPQDKLIRVKSWWPSWDKYGLEWPTMLIDANGYQRRTVTPIWNWPMVRGVFLGHE